MAIFLVVPTANPAEIKNALEHKHREAVLDFKELPKGEFLVSFKGTSEELSNIAGISDASSGLGIVIRVDSYYGRASNDIWEWIKSRWPT